MTFQTNTYMHPKMEVYRNAMIALNLREWIEVKKRIDDEEVVKALHNYVAAYVAYKKASEDYDEFERHDWPITNDMRAEEHELWCEYTKRVQTKKKMWLVIQDVLGDDSDYTSTDEE